jgi:plasmid maintenance system killer protein
MALTKSQFAHAGLWKVYVGGSDPRTIPVSAEGRCRRLLDALESVVKPDDMDIPGMGYKRVGSQHSVDVNGRDRITYLWSLETADQINYA